MAATEAYFVLSAACPAGRMEKHDLAEYDDLSAACPAGRVFFVHWSKVANLSAACPAGRAATISDAP